MAVTDSDDTRLKARAARVTMELMDGHEVFVHLHTLNNALGLKAITAIVLRGDGGHIKHTVAHSEADREVLHDFATGLCDHVLTEDLKTRRGAFLLAVRDDGIIDMATWGSNTAACDAIAEWGRGVMDELPAAPFQTWFGWGNQGRPKPLTEVELATLGEAGRAFAERYTHPRAAA